MRSNRIDWHESGKSRARRAVPCAAAIALACLAALAALGVRGARAQSQSGNVVSQAQFTSPYDAFMKINRLREEPTEAEDAADFWGALDTRLQNQAGRLLIKRPEKGFSEEAFYGWLSFMRAYGEDTGIGNCAVCHMTPAFTDGKEHDIGTGGFFKTPTMREIGEKNSFLHDGSAKTLEAAIALHVKNGAIAREDKRASVDPELGKVSLNEEEIEQVAAFIKTLKSVERSEFRQYLIKVVFQPYETEF